MVIAHTVDQQHLRDRHVGPAEVSLRWLSQGRYRCRVDVVPLNGPAVHYGGNLKVEAYDHQDGSQRFVASLRVRRLPPDSPLYPSLPCPSDEDC
jgi:hypothetical protein